MAANLEAELVKTNRMFGLMLEACILGVAEDVSYVYSVF
jgi:hypothetical protein